MFDIGWPELFVIAVIALVVIGPKDLPKVMRTVGQWVGKAKRMTYDFKRHVDDMINESELGEVRKQMQDVTRNDPSSLVENTLDSDKQIREAFEFGGEELVNVKLADLNTIGAPEPAPASVSAPTPAAAPAPPDGERKETNP